MKLRITKDGRGWYRVERRRLGFLWVSAYPRGRVFTTRENAYRAAVAILNADRPRTVVCADVRKALASMSTCKVCGKNPAVVDGECYDCSH